MRITVEWGESHAILHVHGAFDVDSGALLENQIDHVQRNDVNHVVLNLRHAGLINSTGLGGIIAACRALGSQNGRLVVSCPSAFCEDIFEKMGLARILSIFRTDEEAVEDLLSGMAGRPAPLGWIEVDPSGVLFTLRDPRRLESFLGKIRTSNPALRQVLGPTWCGVGRMRALHEAGLEFTWRGGDSGLSAFEMRDMLAVGTGLSVRFRLPLSRRDPCDATVDVSELEEWSGGVKVGCAFSEGDDETREAVAPYV